MKEKLLIITGPTGIGKTSLSIEIAKRVNGEIISADSMQIYKYMNIGTAKIKDEEMNAIPHHLIDFLELDEDFSVSDFRERAKVIITKLNTEDKIPMVVGGTGLYINSLVYDLNFTRVASDEAIRSRLEGIKEEFGNEYLLNILREIDPKSAEKINVNDTKRVIRSIEIYEITGKPMSQHNNNFRKLNEDYDLVIIGLNMDRKELYNRINQRVDIMIEEGLIDEVKSLLSSGYDKNLVSMQAIGYKEIIMYLENEITLDRAIELIKQGSRNYAKRQLTWFRRDDRVKWFNRDEYSDFNELVIDVIDYTNKLL